MCISHYAKSIYGYTDIHSSTAVVCFLCWHSFFFSSNCFAFENLAIHRGPRSLPPPHRHFPSFFILLNRKGRKSVIKESMSFFRRTNTTTREQATETAAAAAAAAAMSYYDDAAVVCTTGDCLSIVRGKCGSERDVRGCPPTVCMEA